MSAINPVDSKSADPKPAPEQAAALAPAAAPAAKKGMWAALGAKQKLAVFVGGTVLVVAGGMLAVNQFRPTPTQPPAVAQADAPPATQPAPTQEPLKGRFGSTGDDLPDVPPVSVPVKPVRHEDVNTSAPGIKRPGDDGPTVIKAPTPTGTNSIDDISPIVAPPIPGEKKDDPIRKADDEKFPLPPTSGEKKDVATKTGDDDFKA